MWLKKNLWIHIDTNETGEKKILSQQNGVPTEQRKSEKNPICHHCVCTWLKQKSPRNAKIITWTFLGTLKQMLQQQQRTPFVTENPGRQNFHWAITVNSTIIIRLTFNYLQMWWSTCHHLTWNWARTLPECNYKEANEEILNDQQPYQNKGPTFFKTINV